MVAYDYKAKKTKVKGYSNAGLEQDVVEHDSRSEAGLAMLILREEINVYPHQAYDVVDRDGEPHTYEIDFDFHRPHKLRGISNPVSALEYKGVLKPRDLDRKDWWEFSTDRNMYIVNGKSLLHYWAENGMKKSKYKNGGHL